MATGATTIHGDLNTKHNYSYAGMVQNISSTEVTSWQETPIVPIAQKK